MLQNVCNTLQHAATHCNAPATYPYSTLQHTATNQKHIQHICNKPAVQCSVMSIVTHRLRKKIATHCNTLQHTVTHLQHTHSTLQRTATHCDTFNKYATYVQHPCNARDENRHTLTSKKDCNTLQHTATHCSTLQHTATHCNTLQHTATHCKTLQHTATHCNTLQHTTTHYNTLQHTATHCNTLQHTCNTPATHLQLTCNSPVTHCSTLQHAATHFQVSCTYTSTYHMVRFTL